MIRMLAWLRCDRHSCPRYLGSGGTDLWLTDRWGRLSTRWRRWVARPTNARPIPVWPAGFTRPRSCSYCGGVHGEDALALLVEGWRVDPTSSEYKRFLIPPRGLGHAVPPVKLYSWHMTPHLMERWNALIDVRVQTGAEI